METDVLTTIDLDIGGRVRGVLVRGLDGVGAYGLPGSQVCPPEMAMLDVTVFGVFEQGVLKREVG